MTDKSIHVLMAEVADKIGAIGKSRVAPEAVGGYKFRGIDDVLNALHEPLSKAGIVPYPEVIDYDLTERTSTNDRGVTRYQTIAIVKLRVHFKGPLGDESCSEGLGEAQDYGDKAVSKASSVAFRTIMFQTFTIPIAGASIDTETDQDSDQQGEVTYERFGSGRTKQTPKGKATDSMVGLARKLLGELYEIEFPGKKLATADMEVYCSEKTGINAGGLQGLSAGQFPFEACQTLINKLMAIKKGEQ